MIELPQNEPDPIEAAIVEWTKSADLYRNGVLVRPGVNLLGSADHIAKRWAKILAPQLRDGNHDRASLARILNSKDAAQHVRANSSAPMIAEGLLIMLERKGLL